MNIVTAIKGGGMLDTKITYIYNPRIDSVIYDESYYTSTIF